MTPAHEEDLLWETVVTLLHESGSAVEERRSRYGEKPAAYEHGREIAHLEAPGQVDLRITCARGAGCEPVMGTTPQSRRDAKAISHHDDVGNDFYRLVLARWSTPAPTSSRRPPRHTRWRMRSGPSST